MRSFKKLDPDKRYAKVTEFLWGYVFHRDRGLCQICGGAGHHVHHVKYRSHDRNGHYANNLILLCLKCHTMEHTVSRNDVEYIVERISVNEIKFKGNIV